jgi:hypothetical protein
MLKNEIKKAISYFYTIYNASLNISLYYSLCKYYKIILFILQSDLIYLKILRFVYLYLFAEICIEQ